MFKSRISLPSRIRFLQISCYRPLGPYGFGFCKKVKKIFHACVPLNMFLIFPTNIALQSALQRESHSCIPKKGIMWPQSQFPHSFFGIICFKFSVLCLCIVFLLAVMKYSKSTILCCRKEILRILPLRKKEPRVVTGVELVPLNQSQLQVSQWSLHTTQLLSTRANSAQYSPPRELPEAEQASRQPEHIWDLSKPDEENSSH